MSDAATRCANKTHDEGHKVLTQAELRGYDGTDGAPEYIAIHGIVYDITNVNLLKGGKHHGVASGCDVSELFVHNQAILNRLKVVGKLV